jgi:hypothetical protein
MIQYIVNIDNKCIGLKCPDLPMIQKDEKAPKSIEIAYILSNVTM